MAKGASPTIRGLLPLDQQDVARIKPVTGSGGPNRAAGSVDPALARGVQNPKGFGGDPVNHVPVICDTCDADDGHAGRSHLLVQRSPQVGQGALVAFEPNGTGLKGETPTLDAPLARGNCEAL